MKCPYCHHRDSKVVDSRDSELSIRRRRECLNCGRRFTTYERVELAPLIVSKRDGRREEFSREKLLASVRKATDKRPVAPGQVEAIVESIEAELNRLPGNEIATAEIAELVMARLRQLDDIAYIRYASAYREFGDLERVREELERLATTRERERQLRAQPPLFSLDDFETVARTERAPTR
ncbi:MAG: transcriptional regulator NrdR [Chloroflexota bacterium]|nr:transcriptional regulator NrdR [Dehalococcoidia bacterium]MDW8253248.1 transcriptional regulator NrdR [Chloroflexota bacterium]